MTGSAHRKQQVASLRSARRTRAVRRAFIYPASRTSGWCKDASVTGEVRPPAAPEGQSAAGATSELEAIAAEGAGRGELRDDIPAGLLALAIAGLTDLALAAHWASGGTRPALEEIPELVLTLLLGSRPAGGDR